MKKPAQELRPNPITEGCPRCGKQNRYCVCGQRPAPVTLSQLREAAPKKAVVMEDKFTTSVRLWVRWEDGMSPWLIVWNKHRQICRLFIAPLWPRLGRSRKERSNE
jgi:hypothetical protein